MNFGDTVKNYISNISVEKKYVIPFLCGAGFIAQLYVFKILASDEKRNEFDIYKPQGKEIKFHDYVNNKDYYAKIPVQLVADAVVIHGYCDPSYIQYVEEFKDQNLKPILYDGKALMSVTIAKYDNDKTTGGGFQEVIHSYWVTNNGQQLILDTNHIDKYMQHLHLYEMEHKGIYEYYDKLYLDADLVIAVGVEFGYDKSKVNNLEFEYNINNGKFSTFSAKHKECNFDIKLNINYYFWNLQDIMTGIHLVKSFGFKRILKMLFNYFEGKWWHRYYYTKPNISSTRIPKDVTPLIDSPIKRTVPMIKKVTKNDIFEFGGIVKQRQFEPVSYVYTKASYVFIPPCNC